MEVPRVALSVVVVYREFPVSTSAPFLSCGLKVLIEMAVQISRLQIPSGTRYAQGSKVQRMSISGTSV